MSKTYTVTGYQFVKVDIDQYAISNALEQLKKEKFGNDTVIRDGNKLYEAESRYNSERFIRELTEDEVEAYKSLGTTIRYLRGMTI